MILHAVNDSQHSDRRRRKHRSFRILIVERDVSSGNGRFEGTARISHSAYGFLKNPVDLRFVRIAEIQAIRDGNRFSSAANNVSSRFGNGNLPSFSRIQIHVPAVAIRFDSQAPFGSLDADNRRVRRPRSNHRVRPNHGVVLLKDPFLRGNVG